MNGPTIRFNRNGRIRLTSRPFAIEAMRGCITISSITNAISLKVLISALPGHTHLKLMPLLRESPSIFSSHAGTSFSPSNKKNYEKYSHINIVISSDDELPAID
jgi:hypothetical protein